MQIAIYARVSTGKQEENGLSIPDQLRQLRQWAERNGHVVVKEYVESGSATDDKRPAFQDMMAEATMKGVAPFQSIAVHSFSRFFRDEIEATIYQRRLGKHGVKVCSITQQVSDDPSGEIQRRMIMLFDEYQSKENAKHTLRGMQENARQGYFNGSRPPYGYKTVEAGQTGTRGRVKKRLAINEEEAEIVKEIFALYVHGKEDMPRIGMKEIAKHLNERKVSMRGKLWRVQVIHQILTSTTYAGVHVFNKTDSKTFQTKPEAEWVKVQVPAIVSQDLFDQAQKQRAAMLPKMCAPRRETSPNLLTGLLKCDCCGATMVLQTSKNNRYRYYKCSARISKGDTACKSKSYPMDMLDAVVLEAFKGKIYTPEYIRAVVDTLRKHSGQKNGEDKLRQKKLQGELNDLAVAETKLFEAIEKGILDLDDSLKARVQTHKSRKESLTAELAALQSRTASPLQTLTPQKIEAVAHVMNRRFSTSTPFSRAYLRATVSEIRVTGDLVKLTGHPKALASLVAADGKIMPEKQVLGFIPDWRPLRPFNCHFRTIQSGSKVI